MSGRFWQFQQLTDSLKGQSAIDCIPLPSAESPAKIFIGGIAAFHQVPSALEQSGVTHILSVLDFDVPSAAAQLSKYEHLQIDVTDEPESNLLKTIPRTNAFIEGALRAEGTVFVHCAMGVSRSAAIVAAYLMWKYGESRDDTLNSMRKGRSIIRPNEGFMGQLEVWEAMVKKSRGWDAQLYESWKERRRVKL